MDEEQPEKLQDGRPKSWFWEYNAIFDSGLSVHSKIVRLYLARCAGNDSRQAWPSLNNIAEHCGISRATVKRALAELLEAGWLTKETRRSNQGDFASTIYTLQAPPRSSPHKPAGGLAPVEPTLPRDDREGGRLSESLPCPDLTGVGSEGAPNNTNINKTNINNTQDNNTKKGLSTEAVSSLRSDTTSVAAVDLPEPGDSPSSVSPSVSETSGDSDLTVRGMIGALGDAFLEVPGMAERYPPGPQRKRVYALMGRLYNRLDSEPVFRAIDSLASALSKKPVDDPLRYVAGAAEKIAKEMERHHATDEDVKRFHQGLRVFVAPPERRAYWDEQYRLARQHGEEVMRQREERLRAARDLLENPRHSDDPVLDQLYELQRIGARQTIKQLTDFGEAKSIGQLAREVLQQLQVIQGSNSPEQH